METVRSLPIMDDLLTSPNGQWDETPVKEHLRVIRKHKWTVLAFVLAFVGIVSVYNLTVRPGYRATTQLLIEKDNPNVIAIKEVLTIDSADVSYFQTQYQLLQSRALAEKVIKALALEDSPELNPQENWSGTALIGALFSRISGVFLPAPEPENTPDQPLAHAERLVDVLLGRLKVEPVKNSRLVQVSFSGYHPEIVTQVVNTLSRLYIQQDLDRKLEASSQAVSWLVQRLDEMKFRVEQSELALQEYKESNEIVGSQERSNLLEQRLIDLNSTLSKVKAERITLDAAYQLVKELTAHPRGIESISPVHSSRLIQNLKEELIKVQARLAGLAAKFSQEHPAVVELHSLVQTARDSLRVEVDTMVRSVETDDQLAQAKEHALGQAMEELRRMMLEQDKKSIQLGVLQRETDSNKQLYEVLLKRLKETSLTGELRNSNIWVIDEAKVPTKPVTPRKMLNLILATAAALGMGIGLALFFEHLDDTIKTPEDVEQTLKLPYLGAIAMARIGKKAQAEAELITLSNPKSNISEGFRNIRTGILLSALDEPKKMTLVTSTDAGDGKTLVIANLAVTMAQMGHRVLVVDTDMRRPRLHQLFGVHRIPGLSNLLATDEGWLSAVQETAVPNLKILPSGDTPPNPSEILASKRMQQFLMETKELYDYVLFDSAPVMAVTDPIILASSLDSVVLVTRAGETSRRSARRAIQQLQAANTRILGVVLNGVDVRRDGYYYHYYAGYNSN